MSTRDSNPLQCVGCVILIEIFKDVYMTVITTQGVFYTAPQGIEEQGLTRMLWRVRI